MQPQKGMQIDQMPPETRQQLQKMQEMLQGRSMGTMGNAQVAQPLGTKTPTAQTGALQAAGPTGLQEMVSRFKGALPTAQGMAQGVTPGGVMGFNPTKMKKGGVVKSKAKKVSSASKRADGCATKGKTKGRMV
jgi:hypothetical protein